MNGFTSLRRQPCISARSAVPKNIEKTIFLKTFRRDSFEPNKV